MVSDNPLGSAAVIFWRSAAAVWVTGLKFLSCLLSFVLARGNGLSPWYDLCCCQFHQTHRAAQQMSGLRSLEAIAGDGLIRSYFFKKKKKDLKWIWNVSMTLKVHKHECLVQNVVFFPQQWTIWFPSAAAVRHDLVFPEESRGAQTLKHSWCCSLPSSVLSILAFVWMCHIY